jgi:hypothetical protein
MKKTELRALIDRLLNMIEDEKTLESIFWAVNRIFVRH